MSSVKPRKGDAVLFFNLHLNAATDPRSLHGSCPVIEGEKWSASKWIHERPFSFSGMNRRIIDWKEEECFPYISFFIIALYTVNSDYKWPVQDISSIEWFCFLAVYMMTNSLRANFVEWTCNFSKTGILGWNKGDIQDKYNTKGPHCVLFYLIRNIATETPQVICFLSTQHYLFD